VAYFKLLLPWQSPADNNESYEAPQTGCDVSRPTLIQITFCSVTQLMSWLKFHYVPVSCLKP